LRQAVEAARAALFRFGWPLFYPRVFQPQFGLLAGLACVWGLWAVRRDLDARALVWLSTIPPLVVFSVIQNRNLRYTLPILPAAALAATAGGRALGPVARRATGALCLGVGALQGGMAGVRLPAPPPAVAVP